jgi:transposase
MRKQKSPAAFGFDRYDKGCLQRALQEVSDKRTFIRLKAVLLTAEGINIQAIAKLFDKSIQIVYRWIRMYLQTHRPAALYDAPKSGRPASAQVITEECILQELRRNPLQLGYHTTVWTVALLAQHLSNCYGQQIGQWTLYRRMKQMGLRSKRPRYVYSEKDPHRAQKKGGYRTKAKSYAAQSGAAF